MAAAIFISARVAAVEAVDRLIRPRELEHLWALAGAGAIGFLGNEAAAQLRLPGGGGCAARRWSPTAITLGTDGFVSLGVLVSAVVVALGFRLGDPIIGLAITLVILRITWQSIRTIRSSRPSRGRIGPTVIKRTRASPSTRQAATAPWGADRAI